MQERAASNLSLASNTVRWIIGPTGTIVTFSEDIGLPSIFDPVPCRYKFPSINIIFLLFHLHTHTHIYSQFPSCTWTYVITFDCLMGFIVWSFSYPPPREKCAGPNCKNSYKYRDSKSKLPLCSLHCYRAIHQKMQPLITC
jgi:hypothetical protein